jgi:hypothetical protein
LLLRQLTLIQEAKMNMKSRNSHKNLFNQINRRQFLQQTAVALGSAPLLAGCQSSFGPKLSINTIRQCGPASKYTPVIHAAFVRRKEDYGLWWPGAVYDGKAARKKYTGQLLSTAHDLQVKLQLRPEPIYSAEEADAWLVQAKAENSDGLVVMMLDRQKHSWPTAIKAAESEIPSVIFSPLGTSFTTNTIHLAGKDGCVIYSTDDFSQAAYGMKMLKAGARCQRTRCIVLKGDKRFDQKMADLGITLRHLPVSTFLEEYERTEVDYEILALADYYLRGARKRSGATRQDVINGVRSYFVARTILEREQADAITMDCLGAIGKTGSKVSLPCIAWSRMNDDGIPAACEADFGAVASHTLVQYLFDRPGFEQDPVADTLHDAVIGAHCSCPTRLNGFDRPAEPFDLTHHHGNRDAIPRTLWKKDQRVTCIDVLPPGHRLNPEAKRTKVYVSTGAVMDNIDVPPSGGCVVSVRVKFDGDQNVLDFPGFHQVFFYGDFKREMLDFCKLYGLEGIVV